MPKSGPISLQPNMKRFGYFLLCLFCKYLSTEAATFRTRPEPSTNVKLGETVIINCSFDGLTSGSSTIWQKDGNVIFLKTVANAGVDTARFSIVSTPDGHYDLKITSAKVEDGGKYTCSLFGTGAAHTTLTVLVPPGNPVINSNNNAQSTENQIVTLNCSSAGGNPAPSIVWYIDNVAITSEITYQAASIRGGTTYSVLRRTLVYTDHNKQFKCRVTNGANQNSPKEASHAVLVQFIPRVSLGQYKPLVVIEKSNVQLKCGITANPDVNSIHWYQDGQAKIGNTARQITFEPVGKVNAGAYTCEAGNKIGKSNDTVVLQVQYPPKVTVVKRKIINESQNIEITCNVDANPSPHTTKWSQVNSTSFVQTSNILRMTNLKRNQAGTYTCSATNRLTPSGGQQVDRVGTGSTEVVVQYPPGRASIGVTSAFLIGQAIVLTCTMGDPGVPAAELYWRQVGDSQIIGTGQQYRKDQAELSDNGEFECTPKNILGAGPASRIVVEVREQPSFLEPNLKPKESVELTRQSFSLLCRARGKPRPLIRWIHDSVYIDRMENYADFYRIDTSVQAIDIHSENVSSTLRFTGNSRMNNGLKVEDKGQYTCHVTSSLITQPLTKSLELTIQYQPIINDTLQRVAANMNDTATLTCRAKAVPKATFEWQKGGRKINSGGRYSIVPTVSGDTFLSVLKIMQAAVNDFGEYKCHATNAIGRTTITIDLTAKTTPDEPQELAVEGKTWESIELKWKPGFNGGYPQRFHIYFWDSKGTFRKIEDIAGSSHNVTELTPGSTYTFKIFARNAVGDGKYSANLTSTTTGLKLPVVEKTEFDKKNGVIRYRVSDSNVCIKIEKLVHGQTEWTMEVKCAAPVLNDNEYKMEDASQVMDVRLFICLQRRMDVCGQPSTAIKINASVMSKDVSDETIIIVAAVCGGIVLSLIVIVTVLCFQRRRKQKKGYEQESGSGSGSGRHTAGNSTVNSVSSTVPRSNNTASMPNNNQIRSSYDNPALQDHDQDHDSVDFDDPASGGVYSHQQKNYLNNKLYLNGGLPNGGGGGGGGDWNHYDNSMVHYDEDNRRNIMDEQEMNRRNRQYLTEPPYISYQDLKKPKPDLQIGLNGIKNDSLKPGNESGYSTPDPTKPKKVIYEVIV